MNTDEIKDTKLNSWHPITDVKDLKVLGKLLEELGELTSAVSRCIIQGMDERHPITQKSNRVWLEEEIADVAATIELAFNRFGFDVGHLERRQLLKLELLSEWVYDDEPQ